MAIRAPDGANKYGVTIQNRDVIWICSLVTLWKIALAVGSVFTNCCYQPSLSLSFDDDADDDGACDKNVVYNRFFFACKRIIFIITFS